MTSESLDRWLLVNYAGYPYTPSSLMPDNGLANLAGSLLELKKEVEILDYCTVSMVNRMTSPELRDRLTRAWDTVRHPGKDPWTSLKRLATLPALQRCERERRRLQDKAVAEISEELVNRIREKRIQAVGFKLWNGDGFEGAGRLAMAIRRHCPEVKLFGGGPHVDLFLERIIQRYPCFDALVFGEGEDTIRHLALQGGDVRAYKTIPNLVTLADGIPFRTEEREIADLNALPMPEYDPVIYPAMAGDEKVKIIVIDESRGCRNHCAFCIHPVKSHRGMRLKSISRLIHEVQRLDAQYGFRAFRFAGSCTPYSLLNEFAAETIRQHIPLRYASFAHIRGSETADFDLIRKSGCVALFFGIESGSQRILDAMNKCVQLEDIRKALQRSTQAGLFTVGSLIYPAPGDNAESAEETLALLRASRLNSILIQAPVIIPRTDWFEHPETYGITFRNKENYLDVGMNWKVKLQLPPRFWDPLPVQIGGRSYPKVLAETGRMARRIAELGIPTSITDEAYLMSIQAGMEPLRFRDESLRAFFSGNTLAIGDLVSSINSPNASGATPV
ncbi:MAG: radical SAM protein [bacterium]